MAVIEPGEACIDGSHVQLTEGAEGSTHPPGTDDTEIRVDDAPSPSTSSGPPLQTVSGMLGDQLLFDDPPPRPPPPKVYAGYPTRKSLSSGAAQILLGLTCIICQVLAIHFGDTSKYESDGFAFLGAGLWSGLVFIAAGILCLVSSRCKTKTYITWTMGLSFLASGLFGVTLIAMTCIGLSYATGGGRVPCEMLKLGRDYSYKRCNIGNPLLISYITLLVAATMEIVVSFKMALQCYKMIVSKKEDRLEYVRTAEGVLIVMNKGPDYSRGASHRNQSTEHSFYVQNETGEIMCPIQSQAVLHPPPYARDDDGKPASPPSYQAGPPQYYNTNNVTYSGQSVRLS